MKHTLHFKFQGYSKVQFFLGTLLGSVRLCSQSNISGANGNQHLQIEKHMIVSVRSNLPQKSSAVLSEPKFGPPNKKFLDPPV